MPNLMLLNTTMTLNDLADAVEALHVRESWKLAEQANQRATRAREQITRDMMGKARGRSR